MTYILALDQGTSSSRALVYDAAGAVVGSAQQSIDSTYPQDGGVEQDPAMIWSSILAVGRQAIADANIAPSAIAGIGITNQRETSLLWERETSRTLYNAIVWQDRRTADICQELRNSGLEDYVKENTGLVLDPYFSGTKIKWIICQKYT